MIRRPYASAFSTLALFCGLLSLLANGEGERRERLRNAYRIYENPKYQLPEDYRHRLSFDTRLQVRQGAIRGCGSELILEKGYSWDGASGPAIDSPRMLRATAVHDALYSLIRANLLERAPFKGLADSEFSRILREDDYPHFQRTLTVQAVSRFGLSKAASPESRFIRKKIPIRRSLQSLSLFLKSEISGKAPEAIKTRPQLIHLESEQNKTAPPRQKNSSSRFRGNAVRISPTCRRAGARAGPCWQTAMRSGSTNASCTSSSSTPPGASPRKPSAG